MNAGDQVEEDPRFAWLSPRLRPRLREAAGSGQMRLIETTLLILVGVILAVATINDVSRQTGVNRRLQADLTTWRAYTGHDYHSVSIEQEAFGLSTQKDVVCGNTSPGGPKETTQLCLAIWGPQHDGRRTVQGGWYLPRRVEDIRALRYGCFGTGAQGQCAR